MNKTQEVCPVCQGAGWKVVEKGGLSGAVRCECYSATRLRDISSRAGIPPNYASASFENFDFRKDNPDAYRRLSQVYLAVRHFVKEFPNGAKPGLLLAGDTGTSKTYLAIAALKALIDRGHEGVYFNYQDLLQRIRASWSKEAGAAEKEAYRSALDAEILLLDDLGSHRELDWIEDTVTSIITHRCDHRKPLIATTNCPDPEITGQRLDYVDAQGVAVQKKPLADVIGQRARSRLFEMCLVVQSPVIADYRVTHAVKK